MIRGLLVLVTAFLLGGCLGQNPQTVRLPGTVAIDGTVDARLKTTLRNGLFLTRVRIGDRDVGPFLIDTGAYGLVFATELADSLGLKSWGHSYDAETRQQIRFGTIASVTAGPITLQNTTVAVMDLSAVAHALGEQLAGVLGYPFFAKAVVEIDYARQSVAGFDPSTYRLRRGEWQTLIFKDKHPGVAARLEGNAEGVFLLDTGSTYTVHFFPEFVQKHGLLEVRKISKARQLRVSGEHEMFAGSIAWFELAGRRFERPRISFGSPGLATREIAQRFDGIIGHGFMREFVVIFNYPASAVALVLN